MVNSRDYEGTKTLEVLSNAENYNRFVLALMSNYLSPASVVLDYGAGDGTFASLVSPLVKEIHALEPDPFLRSKIEQRPGVSHVLDLDSSSRKYSLIFLINVLEHIEDDTSLLQQMVSSLNDAARIFLYVPASPALFSDFDRSVGHFRRYTRDSLRSTIRAAGLEIEKIEYVDPLGWLAAWTHKALRMNPQITRRQVWFYDRIIFPISRGLNGLFKDTFGKNLVAVVKVRSQPGNLNELSES